MFALLNVALIGCTARQDHYLMRKAPTGGEVTCVTLPYTFLPGSPHLNVANECVAACARRGFRQVGTPYHYDRLILSEPAPREVSEASRPYVPRACIQ
jgi:hypothetical protein